MPPPKFAPVPGLSGPPPMPLLGGFGNQIRLVRDPIGFLGELHGRYGNIAAVTRNDPAMISVLGAEYNQRVLTDADLFNTLDRAGVGIESLNPERHGALLRLTRDPPTWTRRNQMRKVGLPSLHHNSLPAYFDRIVQQTARIFDQWKVGETIDAFHQMHRLTLRNAIRVLFGLDPDSKEYQAEWMGALHLKWIRMVYFGVLWPPVAVPGSPFWKLLKASEELEQITCRIIEEKKKRPTEDLISVMINATDMEGGPLAQDELIPLVHSTFIVSNQTMTDVLSWTLFLLSQDAEWLGAVQEEVDSVLKGGPPAFDKLDQLKLMTQTLDESMRLLGPAAYLFRFAQEDCQLGPFEVPRGARIIFNPFYTHRNPDVFSNPNRFNPRRWETEKPSQFEFIPWGYGAHGCIGSHYAYAEMRIVLSLLLQRFQLELDPSAPVDYQVAPALRPKVLRMIVRDRKARFTRNLARGTVHDILELV